MYDKKFKFRIWTGPNGVDQTAALIEGTGINVTVRGTEHVHIEIGGNNPEHARERIYENLKAPFGGSRAASMAFGYPIIK